MAVRLLVTESDLGGWVHFAYDSTSRSAWYVAALLGSERPLVLVVDPQIRIDELSPYLEFRAEGIWAQHVCETPMQHWTIGLEAFGVTLDQPEGAMGDQWGIEPELAWTLNGSTPQNPRTENGFSQDCFVNGEVLLDDMSFEVASKGTRSRMWSTANLRLTPRRNQYSRRRRFCRSNGFGGESWYGQVLE